MRRAAAVSFFCFASFLVAPAVADVPASSASPKTSGYRAVTDMGSGCKIAVTFYDGIVGRVGNGGSPKFGGGGIDIASLPRAWRSSLDGLHLEISCRNKDDPKNPLPSGIYDERSKSWVKDVPTLRKELAKSSDYSDPQFLAQTVATIRTYDIKTPNAQGWADTGDDLTGDDEKRRRTMSFCVYHANKALCGLGSIANLHDGRKGDLTPQALKIIRSIEFLD